MPTFTDPRGDKAPDQGPDMGARLSIESRILSTQFGDGYVQVMAEGLNPHRQLWDLEFGGLNSAAADLLLVEATAAQTEAVTYQVCDDQVRVYRVVPGTLRRTLEGPDAVSVSFQLLEVFGHTPDADQTMAEVLGL